ncbi:MAG: hypothetical protein IPP47_00775 [Bryobacterales bacterium]|nr:hypothetical protein [Bryobacterales bacterium]
MRLRISIEFEDKKPEAPPPQDEHPRLSLTPGRGPRFLAPLSLSLVLHFALAAGMAPFLEVVLREAGRQPESLRAQIRNSQVLLLPRDLVVHRQTRESGQDGGAGRAATGTAPGPLLLQPGPRMELPPKTRLPSLAVWTGPPQAAESQPGHALAQLSAAQPRPAVAPAPPHPEEAVPLDTGEAAEPAQALGDSHQTGSAAVISLSATPLPVSQVVHVPQGQSPGGQALAGRAPALQAPAVQPPLDQNQGSTPAGIPGLGPIEAKALVDGGRFIPSPLGRIQVREGLDGSQTLTYPPRGKYDVLVLGGASDPDPSTVEALLTGRPVHTVFLPVASTREWILKFCLPQQGSQNEGGTVVRLSSAVPLAPPYILVAVLPAGMDASPDRPWMIAGRIDVDGRFRQMKSVGEASAGTLLPFLERWHFRPAVRGTIPAEVEVVLIVPEHAR